MEELFKEQLDDLRELVRTGTNYKDANLRIWKKKEMVVREDPRKKLVNSRVILICTV